MEDHLATFIIPPDVLTEMGVLEHCTQAKDKWGTGYALWGHVGGMWLKDGSAIVFHVFRERGRKRMIAYFHSGKLIQIIEVASDCGEFADC